MKQRNYSKEVRELLSDGETFFYFPSHQAARAWCKRVCEYLEKSTGMYASSQVVKSNTSIAPWRASVHGAYDA